MYIMGYILKGRDEDGTEYLMHYGVKGMKWEKHLNSVLSEPQQADKKVVNNINGTNRSYKIVSSVGNGNTIDNIKNTYKINKTKRAINKVAKAQTNAIKSTVKGYVSNAKNELNTAVKSAKKPSTLPTAKEFKDGTVKERFKMNGFAPKSRAKADKQAVKDYLDVHPYQDTKASKAYDKVSSTIKSLIKNKKKK